MKTCICILVTVASLSAQAATTINAVNKHAWGDNIGWLNWQGDVASGPVVGEFVCSGYVWSANVGWINLGGGAPINGIHYQNNSAADFGVNHDGLGNLTGNAWGANIGWLTFTNRNDSTSLYDGPKVDLKTGRLGGFVWSANCGWISLSNVFAHVQTDTISPGADSDGDGIADAWELSHTNILTAFTAEGDTDGDGVSDKNEYLADTNPSDPNDRLQITSLTRGSPSPSRVTLLWTSRPTRCYAIQERFALDGATPWMDLIQFPTPGTGGATLDDFSSQRFYRIRAFRSLAP